MAVNTLGKAPSPPSEELNGLAKKNSRLSNGTATVGTRRKISSRPTSSWRAWLFNTVARCPATLEECDEASPAICNAYFRTKAAVLPHVEPYYDEYAAPYVDIVHPYVQAVSNNVITPTRAVIERYGAPKAQQAKEYLGAHWATTAQPQVDKVRELANEQYQRNLAPHVDQASQILSPYYDAARTSAARTYDEFLLPGYEFVKPYALVAYDTLRTVTTETVVPSTVWAFNKTYTFLDGNVWPHVKGIYVENVEPQLVRIGQRLGRYRDAPTTGIPKKSVPPSHDTKSSSFVVKPSESAPPRASSSVASVQTTSISTVPSAESSAEAKSEASAEAPPADNNEVGVKPKSDKPDMDEVRRIAAETVAEDLHQWQTKFANAADEGAIEIEDKVDQISSEMIESHVKGQGLKLVAELKEAAAEEIAKLHKNIVSLVQSSSRVTRDETEESAVRAVRQAGLVVKEKAQKIRSWRENFEAQLHQAVTAAAQEHFNILGNMRDLALQKIGMKWAWMEGVTYKDWTKYHEMKKRFDQWTDELQQLIVTHPSLEAAMNAAADVEDDGMEEAQGAALELARLKQVALWKIEAGDATDNFDSDAMRLAAEAAIANTEDEAEPIEMSSTEQQGADPNVGTAPEDAPEPVPEADVEDEEKEAAKVASEPQAAEQEAADPMPIEENFDSNQQSEPELPPIEQAVDAGSPESPNSAAPIVVEAMPVLEPEIESEGTPEPVAPEPVEDELAAEPVAADPAAVEQDVKDSPTIEDAHAAPEKEEEGPDSIVPAATKKVPPVQPAVSAVPDPVEANDPTLEQVVEERESEDGEQGGILSKVSMAAESAGSKLSEALAGAHSGVAAGLEDQEGKAPVAVDTVEEPEREQTEAKNTDTLLWSDNSKATQETRDEL
ncbi:hypothetical protein jhhlp_001883 [Lomentospora prolificans]|uniref:Transcription factor hoxa13 n=1 Tax=Lomentospora prolificans TaxID=41688 RepID=A0A2N3NCJ4_9PEZI|nr:hypothetical protein jhhlp_001883 [Lomentospora prolificans]